jgi:uncharacterized membrane protein YphA (DoxX/SURF4 family)
MDTTRTYDRGSAAVAALLLIQVCIGYEWLVSGLSKLVHGDFPRGLAEELREMSEAAPVWYRSFLDAVVIPHATTFGYAIEIAEVAAGIVLLVAVLRLPARISRYVPLATAAALLVGLVLALNFALASGSSFGLSLAQESFDEGIDLDTLLVGLQLALLVFALAGVRRARRQEPISNSRRTSLRLVLRSVFSLRHPTTRAQATSYVPAGNSLGRVPGNTTARGGT